MIGWFPIEFQHIYCRIVIGELQFKNASRFEYAYFSFLFNILDHHKKVVSHTLLLVTPKKNSLTSNKCIIHLVAT